MCFVQRPLRPKVIDGHRTILIVEDHPATGKALMGLLKAAFPEYQLFVAESAESALERCEIQAPELVVMDISLPGMNGLEATRRIKTLSPATHVVMHTNNDMQIFQDESEIFGASAFVSKRDSSAYLVQTITRLLESAGQPPEVKQ